RQWEEVFDGLARLRKEEGIDLDFVMQVDVTAYKIPNFVKKAAEAGCTSVFVGIESFNPDTLKEIRKKQNLPEDYAAMVEAWHSAGVHIHASYIIGFPNDTYESAMEAVDRLANELKADQASFFMLTPLPGSRDWDDMVAAGVPLDEDFNRYDSSHALMDHPRMSREQWLAAYRDAWKRFYSFENMKAVLLRSSIHSYWGLIYGFIWYRAAMLEGIHPMLIGFFRLKDRAERRPGYAIDSRWAHFRKRSREVRSYLRAWLGLFFEMQELWLQTRIPAESLRVRALRKHLGGYATGVKRSLRSAQERLHTTVGYMRDVVMHNAESLLTTLRSPKLPDASKRIRKTGLLWWHRLLEKIHVLSVRGISTRRNLDHFWKETILNLRRRNYWRINPFKVFWNFLRDLRLSFSFTLFMLGERVF
ncbi:radical SAM protein, partial [Candidatus Sumerlaeota bacterium]|nr:radical SAM protein [Candidatus Sumerlaeota bacterium]